MRSIYHDLLDVGAHHVDTEILNAAVGQDGNFRLDFAYWPDIFQYPGEKNYMRISACGVTCEHLVDAKYVIGYEVRDIVIDDAQSRLRIDTTIRRIDLVARDISFAHLPKNLQITR